MESFTAPKQSLKEPLRSGEDDNMSGFKQPSKIIEIEKGTDKEKEIEPVVTEELSLEKTTDIEDTEPLRKALELTEKPSTSDKNLMSLEDLLKQIPDDMMMPSVTAAEPTEDKLREQVIEEFVKFFNSFSLRRLAVLDSVKDIAAKEELVLTWAETDSVHIALKRRMKEHKLEWTRPYSSHLLEGTNVQPGVFLPRSNTKFKSTCWIRAMILVDGSWLIVVGVDYWRPISRGTNSLFQSDGSTIYRSPSPRLEPSVSSENPDPTEYDSFSQRHLDSVTADPIVQIETDQNPDPIESNSFSQRNPDTVLNSPSSSTSADSLIHFTTDDIPLGDAIADDQIILPTTAIPTTDFTESFAQLRAFVNKLSIKQLRTKDNIGDLKNQLLSKIDNLEKALAESHTQQDQVLRGLIKNVRQKVQIQKAAISLEILEFKREVQAHNVILTIDLADIRKEF
ncbi:Splicing factor 3B subunit [Dorcoceras hygrometricum]|uniref:Splicing factor 3B subunit n=1 Tax=Dorcoceras hygrometricum TaxID=472368 RepID=A0A2Z7D0X8_9LAMI|nr:Splicing factor 3B subunit [Dorcoceras hygrometricum]